MKLICALALLVAVTGVAAAQAPQPDPLQQLQQWLWPRRSAPASVPLPPAKPQSESAAKPAPSQAKPSPQVESPQNEIERPAVRPGPIARRKQARRTIERPSESKPPQTKIVPPKPKRADGPCLPFFVTCALVCVHARSGTGGEHRAAASACQIREAKACIRSHCPEVFSKRR